MPGKFAGIIARDQRGLAANLPGAPPRSPDESVLAHAFGWSGANAQLTGPLSIDSDSGTTCVAAARIDNRGELLRQLGLQVSEWGEVTPASSRYDDAHLIHVSYLRWGEACVERIYGDWSFAVWHPVDRRLFLARDHFGLTSLYYALDSHTFAFANDQQVLIDADLAPVSIDEFYLAQLLIAWPAYHGERTVRKHIKRLPPAHTLAVEPHSTRLRQYWFLEDTPELLLTDRREYVEGFREVFDEAVRARLRRDRGGQVAAALSGGLDSGSTTATAANMLVAESERIQAYTSVPLADTRPFVGTGVGDEWPAAQMTARHEGNIDHHAIFAERVTPIQGIRSALRAHCEPTHSAANAYWITDLAQTAAEADASVLLIGQFGNAGISWPGSTWSQPIRAQLTRLGPGAWVRQRVARTLPPTAIRQMKRRPNRKIDPLGSAVNPALAARLDLARRRALDPDEQPPRTPRSGRMWLQPGRSFVGALHAQTGRAAGIDMRDPSGDARVLAYTWSVPDRVFYDSRTRTDRWLIREAMNGRLPDQVRLNRRPGLQAADVCIRLRRTANEVEDALSQVASSEAARHVVDVSNLRESWRIVATQDTPRAFRLAVTTLMRGLAVGLFLSDLPEGPTARG